MQGETSVARDDTCIPRFDLNTKDEGGYAGVALALMRAKITGKEGEMILCMPNQGTVDWLKDTDVIEVSCHISEARGCAENRSVHASGKFKTAYLCGQVL